jgi:carbon storage regulator
MLVLSRKVGQRITIGGEIKICILNARRGRVQLGVTAPRHIRIERVEGHEAGQDLLEQPCLSSNADLASVGALDAPSDVCESGQC